MEASSLMMSGKIDEGLSIADEGLKNWPNSIELLETKANGLATKASFAVYPKSGENCFSDSEDARQFAESALGLFHKIIELEPRRVQAFTSRSNILFMLGYRDRAFADIEKAVEYADPTSDPIIYQMAKQMHEEMKSGRV